MAADNIAICNQALYLLRADRISALASTGSNETIVCNEFYADFVNDILTRYPWSFATKKALLTATTAPLTEYKYAHTYPTEALRLWSLFPSASVGANPVSDYDIFSPTTGRVIISNNSTLYADYTLYRTEVNWPAYFVIFATKALAARIAMPITDKPELAEFWKKEAFGSPSDNELGGAFGVACRLDAQQKPGETIISSPLIEARFS